MGKVNWEGKFLTFSIETQVNATRDTKSSEFYAFLPYGASVTEFECSVVQIFNRKACKKVFHASKL